MEEWKAFKKGYVHPLDESGSPIPVLDMDTSQVAKYTTNMKALNCLMYALSPNEYNKISAYRTAKEVWDKLETMHEGTSQVKKTKIRLLMHEYKTFSMHEHETISQMHE